MLDRARCAQDAREGRGLTPEAGPPDQPTGSGKTSNGYCCRVSLLDMTADQIVSAQASASAGIVQPLSCRRADTADKALASLASTTTT